MIAVNTHEAKTHLSRLLKRVEAGESVIIGRGGKPVARIVAYRETSRDRVEGLDRGKVRIPADFDELPEEILRSFET